MVNFFKIFLIIFAVGILSISKAEVVNDFNLTELSQDATWLKLLYYSADTQKSRVISKGYFLSPDGQTNPKSELKATIDAYYAPTSENPNNDAICSFPARYMWLSKKINLPNYHPINSRCELLSKNFQKIDVKSFSLMFVSGYLGNPASAFGHSFLKLNSEKIHSSLFDLTLSYGAVVPENENAFIYVLKGLSGGYESRFSDKYFYTHDLVYTQNELRDIWEYQLDLTDEKVMFLLLHIFEITGKKFNYFFLNKNCAFEITKLLELVIDEPLVKNTTFWYAPIESFHRVAEINQEYLKDKKLPLIKKIIFHPSTQKIVYKDYDKLSTTKKEIATELIDNDSNFKVQVFIALNEKDKIEIVDFLLKYYQYTLIRDTENQDQLRLKNKVLLQRLLLKNGVEKQDIEESLNSPDLNNKPMAVSSMLGYNDTQGYFPSLGFNLFAIESIGQNNLDGNELVVMDTKLGFHGKQNNVFLDKFDLIRIKKFETMEIPSNFEYPLSWQLQIGAENVNNLTNRYDIFINGGIGKTWKPTEELLVYSMANFSLHSEKAHARITPTLGTRLDLGKMKGLFSVGYETNVENIDSYYIFESQVAYSIFKDVSIFLKHKQDTHKSLLAGLQFFF